MINIFYIYKVWFCLDFFCLHCRGEGGGVKLPPLLWIRLEEEGWGSGPRGNGGKETSGVVFFFTCFFLLLLLLLSLGGRSSGCIEVSWSCGDERSLQGGRGWRTRPSPPHHWGQWKTESAQTGQNDNVDVLSENHQCNRTPDVFVSVFSNSVWECAACRRLTEGLKHWVYSPCFCLWSLVQQKN